MRRATIKDVAKMAGVNASTVSRVLSGGASISEETRKKVIEAAGILSYTPNTAARSLRCEKSRSIGVVFPDMSGEFYAACASAILKYARDGDYTVLFTESGRNIKAERSAVRALMDRCVDGLIFIGDNADGALIHELRTQLVPIVTGDRKIEGIPSVTLNNRETVKKMVKGLCSSGRKRFVYIGEPTEGQDNLLERYAGFTDAAAECDGVEMMSVFDESLHIDKPGGAMRLFAEKILPLKPDAVVTSNDLIAQGILCAANKKGIKIPDDIAVTGFDDMISSRYFIPSITTVRQDTDELAKKCFEALTALIDGGEARSAILKQKIIVRRSADILGVCSVDKT